MGEKRLAVGKNKGAPRNSACLKGFYRLLAENADAHNAKFLPQGCRDRSRCRLLLRGAQELDILGSACESITIRLTMFGDF